MMIAVLPISPYAHCNDSIDQWNAGRFAKEARDDKTIRHCEPRFCKGCWPASKEGARQSAVPFFYSPC